MEDSQMPRLACSFLRLWLVAWLSLVVIGSSGVAQDESGTTSGDSEAQQAADTDPVADQESPEPVAPEEPAPAAEPATEEPAAEEPATEEASPEEKPAAEEKPAEEEMATDQAPAEDTPAGAAPADAAANFQAKLAELKKILVELNQLRAEYRSAEQDETQALQDKWDALISRGEEQVAEVTAAGKLAFLAAPNASEEVTEFLLKRVANAIKRDDYTLAADLAIPMLESGCKRDELTEAAGVAAFVMNDFDNAEKYLSEAQRKGVLGPSGMNYLGDLESQRKLWEQEKKIREAEAAANDLPRVRLTTTAGEIVVELFENEAPGAVGNFISLVEDGFYDGLIFHRVLPGFMAQGGCPEGTGTGGPGYEIYCECDQENYRRHFAGTLSMAHAGKDTGGSQFFLTFVPTSFLNGRHTAFGRVIEGMDVLPKIQRIDPESKDPKAKPTKIIKAEVVRKRDHEYKPNKTQ
jgi:cyclophilin family peptidyl-prolyl cis-trans isomerase